MGDALPPAGLHLLKVSQLPKTVPPFWYQVFKHMSMQRALYMNVIIQFTWAINITQTPWLPRHHVVLPLPTSHLVSSLHLAQTRLQNYTHSLP